MKLFNSFLFGVMLTLLFHLWVFGWQDWSQSITYQVQTENLSKIFKNEDHQNNSYGIPILGQPFERIGELGANDNQEEIDEDGSIPFGEFQSEGTSIYIGMDVDELLARLGEPDRKDPSLYGYTWWIYNQDWQHYIQIGVNNRRVVTLYTNAPGWTWNGIHSGTLYADWSKGWQGTQKESFSLDDGTFSFVITAEEMKQKPLWVKGEVAVQLYIDIHDQQKVAAMRIYNGATLLKHRPYTLEYVGDLPSIRTLTAKQWDLIELASERQIFDIVNVTRRKHNLPIFTWDEEVSSVAEGHSLDMYTHDFFAHDSPYNGGLKDRLDQTDVEYKIAGENIAYNYMDGPDVHHGWLNSLGHRKNLLKPAFTHLGIGVVHKYYTQNFITKH